MKKFFKEFYYEGKGLDYSFRTQVNFRVQRLAALFVTLLSAAAVLISSIFALLIGSVILLTNLIDAS